MNIELKKIKVNLQFSEETIMFTASLYINKIEAGYAKNDGHGGCTHIQWAHDRGRELITEAQKYLATLPAKQMDFNGEPMFKDGQPWMHQDTLDDVVDGLIGKYVEEKEKAAFQKKLQKSMADHIIVGNDSEYSRYKPKLPIAQYTGPVREQSLVNILQNLIKQGDLNKTDKQLLNTNIPDSILSKLIY
jgi:hypothetical protein